MPSDARSANFEELALPLPVSLYNHAYWLAGNCAEAEDFVQEAIFKSPRAFASLQPSTNYKAWIFCVLRNTFLASRTGIVASRNVFLADHAAAWA